MLQATLQRADKAVSDCLCNSRNMSFHAFVIVLLVATTPELSHAWQSAVPCDLPCNMTSTCRLVLTCETANCPIEPRCVLNRQIAPAYDQECNNGGFDQVLLILLGNNAYSQVSCNPPPCVNATDCPCPNGTICTDDMMGGALCCADIIPFTTTTTAAPTTTTSTPTTCTSTPTTTTSIPTTSTSTPTTTTSTPTTSTSTPTTTTSTPTTSTSTPTTTTSTPTTSTTNPSTTIITASTNHATTTTTNEKQGLCPKKKIYNCKGYLCENDYDCPGIQKCCACNGYRCTDPYVRCGNGTCYGDDMCIKKKPYCPEGSICNLPVIFSCVPRACFNCVYPHVCKLTLLGYRCLAPKPVDPCGGCPVGKVCKPVSKSITCTKPPCPKYRCVPVIKY